MGTFSIRPNVSLNLYMSKADDAANNRSLVSWDLQLNETAQQSSFNLTANNTASVSFSYWNGSTAPAIANYTFDFRPTGLQNFSIGSGSFYVTHQTNGVGGTVSGSASAAAPNDSTVLGVASASASVGLADYNRAPVFSDSTVVNTATRGTAYSNGVSASNTSSYSVFSGALPTGLSLNTSTGAITGTPTVVGVFNFVIRATGSFEGTTNTGTLTITVRPATPVFSDGTVDSSARVGIAYSDGVTASEAASYSVFSGSLPAGLSLNTSTGAITGTPTTPGTSTFVIRATNVTGSANTDSLTITAISAARVWDGTAFVSGLVNVWNGTAFVSGTIKVWDGTTWVNTN